MPKADKGNGFKAVATDPPPVGEKLLCRREGAWLDAICQYDGLDWIYLSAPARSSGDGTALNPMLPPTHWSIAPDTE